MKQKHLIFILVFITIFCIFSGLVACAEEFSLGKFEENFSEIEFKNEKGENFDIEKDRNLIVTGKPIYRTNHFEDSMLVVTFLNNKSEIIQTEIIKYNDVYIKSANLVKLELLLPENTKYINVLWVEKIENLKPISLINRKVNIDANSLSIDLYNISVSDNKLSGYFETEDNIYNLQDAKLKYNGYDYTGQCEIEDLLDSINGNVELRDSNSDGYFDEIYVTDYITCVAQEVFANNTKIGMISGAAIDLSKHLQFTYGYSYSILLDGTPIEIEDIREYDVLSIKHEPMRSIGTPKNIEIIVSRNVIEGEVEAIERINKTRIYTINGKEYNLAGLENTYDIPTIYATSEGKFYLDHLGNIAWFVENRIKGNVAFIQGGAETVGTRGAGYEVEVLNKDGSVHVLQLADKVKVNRSATTTSATTVGDMIDGLLDATDSLANRAKLVVTYKVNTANKISSISFAGEVDELYYDYTQHSEYSSSTLSFDEYGINENTVIFYVPIGGSYDDHRVLTIDALYDETRYNVAFYNIDDYNNAGVVLVTYGSMKIDEDTDDETESETKTAYIQGGVEVLTTRGIGYEVELLNKDGSVHILQLADQVKVNGSATGTYASEVGWHIDTLLDAPNSLFNRAKLIVTYKVNSANKISTINFSGEVEELEYDANAYTQYSASTTSFDEYGINEDTVIFYVPIGGSYDDHRVLTIDALYDETHYDVAFYNIDEANNAGVVLVTYGSMKIDEDTDDETESETKTAYIQGGAETYGTRGIGYEVEVLNKDGSVQVIRLADQVKVNGATTVTDVATVGYKIDELLYFADSLSNRANLLVTYKVNTANKISAINFAGEVEELEYDTIRGTEYSSSTLSFDQYGINENTVIFYVPFGGSYTVDDHRILTIDALYDETRYDVAFFDIDEYNNAGIILVTYGIGGIDVKAPLALVTKVAMTTNDNDDDVYAVTFLQNGESKTLKTAADFADWIEPGDIFEYSVNFDGDIDKAKFPYSLYDPSTVLSDDILSINAIKDIALGKYYEGFRFDVKKIGNTKVSYIGGWVAAKSGSILTLVSELFATLDDGKYVIDLAGSAKVNVGTSCNVYTIDYSTVRKMPKVATLGDVKSVKISSITGDIEKNEDTFVLIKYVDKTIVDVIAFNGFCF